MSRKNTNIYQYLQTEAIAGNLTNSDLAFFRKVCRWYSTTFHTPLHQVMLCKDVQWDEILLHYYENQMEDLPFNNVYEIACQDFIPDLADEFEKENEEYAQALVEEQKRTIEAAKKKKPSKYTQKTDKKELSTENNKKKPPEMKMSFEDEEV